MTLKKNLLKLDDHLCYSRGHFKKKRTKEKGLKYSLTMRIGTKLPFIYLSDQKCLRRQFFDSALPLFLTA